MDGRGIQVTVLDGVAAAAVAVALTEQAQNRIGQFPMPNTALVSAWQLGMRTRQMYQKGSLKQ